MKRNEIRRFIAAFFAAWAVAFTFQWHMRNPLVIAVFAVMWGMPRYCEAGPSTSSGTANKRSAGTTSLKRGAAGVFTAMVVLATYGDAAARFESAVFKALVLVIMVAGWFAVFEGVLGVVFGEHPEEGEPKEAEEEEAGPRAAWVAFAACMVCYLPWYLYSYPGIFSPDPINQAEQALHVIPYGNHHPVVHTWMMEVCYRIGEAITGSVNGGFGCYTFVQMTLLSAAFAVMVHTLQTKLHAAKRTLMFVTLFCALVPFHAVQAVTVSKDTVFAAVTIFFTCNVVALVTDGLRSIPRMVWFVVTGVLFCLLRTNGYYAFWLFAAVFVILFKNERKRAAGMALAVIVLATLIRGPVFDAAGVEKGDLAEKLHVPAQQIARVIVNHRALTEEEEKMIRDVIDVSWVEELYVPGFADNIKELIRAGHPEVLEANKGGYFLLWMKLGLKHPLDYIAAWADLTKGYLYPDGDYEVATLEGVYGNDIGLFHEPKLPVSKLYKVRELAIKSGEFVPLYGSLFSMGTFTWLYVFATFLILYQGRNRRRLAVLMPGIAVIITLLLATPVSDDFRYAYSYIAASPLLLIACGKYVKIET